ncbi:hypothetical protein ABFS82_08G088200 [Erythranthe guttata]
MNLHPLSIVVVLLFLCLLIKFTAAISNPTHFTGDVSINCGAIDTSIANNGKGWVGDVQPKSSSLLQIKGSSTTSNVVSKLISFDPVPYKTARISQSQFFYAFQVGPGEKILRFHFNPTLYKGFEGFKDLFTVEAGPFTLLSNFSASLAAEALGVDSFVKEFCLHVQENQKLNIIFSPESSQSLDTYAFINGIEIFTVPASHSYFEGGDVGLQLVGEKSRVYIDSSTALEIFHQVEFKQNNVGYFHGLFPKWENVNTKRRHNNTWKMPVDVGFKYLIRVHFSELGLKVAGNGDNTFKVLINEMIARTNIDLVKESDENNIRWYRDYMVMVRGNKNEGKRDILISLQSYGDLIGNRVLVSGFEIFKLSNSDNSLASPNPSPLARDSASHTVQTLFLVLYHRNAIADVAIAMISLVCIIVYNLREIQEANITDEGNKIMSKSKPKPSPSARAERTCRRFSLDEILLATENFSDALLIGNGGFGKVYKGHIDNEHTTIAIKRLESNSKQGPKEFLTEIETLSELRHVNLVSLIGYCNEKGEMILVYEYMPCGTLADHIYKLVGENNTCSYLTWKQRLDTCIGAGRALDYLHTCHGVIHRDVKTSNILLDENFIAKVSDFGLAKLENKSKLKTHITTNVKGTYGYLDPNYVKTQKLSRKSDTYAFGVVLLEVLCGRPAVDLENDRVLSMWARDKINMGEGDQIVSVGLREEISPDSLKTFVGVAQRCLSDELENRPTMSQVVSQLELAVEQQETKKLRQIAASVSDDNHCLNNDKDGLSVQTRQPSIFSTAMQNFTPPLKEQTNSNLAIARLPHNDNNVLTVQTSQPATFSTAVYNFTPPSKEQTNRNVVIAQLRQNDNDSLLVQTRQPTIFSTAVQNFAPPPKEQTNSDIIIAQLPVKGNELPSISEIKKATGNLDDNSIINKGYIFNVHKGFIEDGATTVAIKRLTQWSISPPTFRDKIEMLQQMRHLNLVSLIGYCDEGREKILVYDYMACGSLHDHLYNSEKNITLTWKRRLQICLGTAVGLHYLHTHKEYNHIMHRTVCSANILLDEKWVAKVSFGPRYTWLLQWTIEDDVFYLGGVLFEVLLAKPGEPKNMAKCVEFCKRKGTLVEKVRSLLGDGTEPYIDSNLHGQIAPECLSKFVETALSCINKEQSKRPTMSDVVRNLEFTMQLQEAAEHRSGQTASLGGAFLFAPAVQNFTPPPKEQTNSNLVIAQVPVKGNELPSISGEFDLGTSTPTTSESCSTPDLLRCFSFEEIKKATDNLDDSSIINKGYLFNVHKGFIEDGATTVAIKRLTRWSISPPKFRDKIEMMQQMRHLNLVSLIGYCDEGREKILVYDYMACGSLHDHLYNSKKNTTLTWKRRLQICLGAAVGLHYIHIHKEYNHIMHRTVCSANILLDEKWVAKISFGPRYTWLLQWTTEDDVFYLGVVLFEVLFAKPGEPINLAKCVEFYKRKGTLMEKVRSLHGDGKEPFIDYNLYSQIAPKCLSKFVETALSCINKEQSKRPTMIDVVRNLELAMQLQEASEH